MRGDRLETGIDAEIQTGPRDPEIPTDGPTGASTSVSGILTGEKDAMTTEETGTTTTDGTDTETTDERGRGVTEIEGMIGTEGEMVTVTTRDRSHLPDPLEIQAHLQGDSGRSRPPLDASASLDEITRKRGI